MSEVHLKIEKVLQNYTQDEFYDDLKAAKESFIKKTGRIDEEAEEYEGRMNSFNDWYLFNYRRENGEKIIDHFLETQQLEDNFKAALDTVKYSLFHFAKINFRKQVVIKDVLHGDKFTNKREENNLGLVEDDLFVGRTIEYNGEIYILDGLCTIPREVLSILKKESKKIRKLNNVEEEEVFLLNLERLKTKSLQYGHIDSSKIFTF